MSWEEFEKIVKTHSIAPEMTPELAQRLKEKARQKVEDVHAKRMEQQKERLAKLGPPVDRAAMYLREALRYRARTGFWPSPNDLPHLQPVRGWSTDACSSLPA